MINISGKAIRGLPLDDILVIDCHCHMGYYYNFNIPAATPESMVQSMDNLGVDIACVSHHSAIGPDYSYGNDLVIRAIEKHPGRFIGYVTINPNYKDAIKSEIVKCFKHPEMKGIKLHPGIHNYPVDHKNYYPAFEAASERQCPVLIHVWGSSAIAEVGRVASRYPEAILVMGHGGGNPRAMEEAVDMVNKHENVYVDLALSTPYEGNVEWFVREIGSSKVLFGSDMPFFDPRPVFGRVAMADISDEDKKNILGLNMRKLLV